MTSTPPETTVAVVGLSCRLPGGINSPKQLWADLLDSRDLVTEHRENHPRATILPAAILDEHGLGFDATHFGLSATEAAAMDPQQQMLLELVDEAFQDAGMALSSWQGRRVGLWVGSSCLDQALLRLGPGQGGTMVDTAGALPSMLANRVSRHPHYDWTGPSEVIDTACSASLVAVHRARQALLCGEVDLAVVAGTNTLRLDTHTRMFAASRVLAQDGRVHAFARTGTGFVRGEGGGVVVLQRTTDLADTGLRPRALLAGSLTNCDGAGAPIGTPSVKGQVDLLTRAYAHAGIDPNRVDYVEAHGTGTPAGDGAEARALGRVLARGRAPGDALLVGSVKTNLGHLEGAAGIVSLIKTVLSVEQEMIAPTLHHREPLPILARMGLDVPTEARCWPRRGHTPTAGVSAFGFGGTNAHVIVQQAPPHPGHSRGNGDRAHVVPVSASSAPALRWTALRFSDWFRSTAQAPVEAAAATAAHRRDHHTGARAAVVASTPLQAAQALAAAAQGRTHLALAGPRRPAHKPRVVFVYPGHGAHPDSAEGDHGLSEEPVFIEALEQARRALARAGAVPGLAAPGLASVQPAQWAWQVAATALLGSWGITPDAVVGHSLGEIAAAVASGVLDLEDAARVVAERSRLLDQASSRGELLATSLSSVQAHEVVQQWPAVAIASINAACAVVLSGPTADLAKIGAQLAEQGVWTRCIPDAPPAHSPLVADQAVHLPARVASVRPRPARTQLWSTATGQRIQGPEMDADYWGRQLRSPVLLHQAVRALAGQEHPVVVVEIGARPVLSGALAATLAQAQPRYENDPPLVATAGPAEPRENFLAALADLYTFGADPAWPAASSTPAVPLPLRAWTRQDTDEQPDDSMSTVRLGRLAPDQTREVIADQVSALVQGLLPQGSKVGPDTVLADAGLQSLSLAHLYTQLRSRLPDLAGLPPEVVQRATTTSSLIDAVYEHWISAMPAQALPAR